MILAVAHHEDLGHRGSHQLTARTARLERHLRHDDVVLLDHPHDGDDRAPRERGILDLAVVRLLAVKTEVSEHGPVDVVGQARQDLLVI